MVWCFEIYLALIMPNKCVAFGCKSNYDSEKKCFSDAEGNKVSTFSFPLKKPELLSVWIKFVNRVDFKPSENSVLCEKHFNENLIKRGGQRNKLIWKSEPTPTIHSEEARKRPSVCPTPSEPRKPPKVRNIQPDELQQFIAADVIKDFSDIDPIDLINNVLPGFQFKKNDESIVFYKLNFDVDTHFPVIQECIKIDHNLHVQLQYNGSPIPLPSFFVKSHNAKLKRISMLENFPTYMRNVAEENIYSIMNELRKRQHYKPQGRPPFSAELIRYALLLRYTSAQAYKLLLDKFPLPSFSLLQNLQKGGVDSVKAAKILNEKGEISKDIVLMADEMYLQKSSQYYAGNYVGANEEGDLYKGIVVFMISGLKKTVPTVIKASPETTVNGEWLANELSLCIIDLINAGFKIRGVVTDNHSANVRAFQKLLIKYPGDGYLYMDFPGLSNRVYLFFDTVHLLKNIRNNLLNVKKFVFPAFEFHISDLNLSSGPGYICWADLHSIYDTDKNLDGNLRKAPKLTYKSLHPSDNKQNVELAIAIFHETTIVGCQQYLPNRPDMASFLKLVSYWWNIANSKKQFTPNNLSNGFKLDDGKLDFYKAFADWIESWAEISDFCLSKQTAKALVRTLRAQSMLIEELLAHNDYLYVLGRRLQSDPLEKRFSQYRQMNGGRFLVSLREVLMSERILKCRSLLKEDINIWEERLKTDLNLESDIIDIVSDHESSIYDLSLSPDSKEVAITIAGYIAKKLLKRFKCHQCRLCMIGNTNDLAANHYLNLLSRGGLIVPSSELAEFVEGAFAILDYTDEFIQKEKCLTTRDAAERILKLFAPKSIFTCCDHIELGHKFGARIIVNVFYNNKQKLSSDEVRKDAVISFKGKQRRKDCS
jgi:hypothetical protein